jgi:hypothetical protein
VVQWHSTFLACARSLVPSSAPHKMERKGKSKEKREKGKERDL